MILFLLILCLCLSACNKGLGSGIDPVTEPKVDPNAEPEIVLDVASAKVEKSIGTGNRPAGYFRYTEGTNCGVAGVVLMEYLDLQENVVYSFSPKLPGGTLTLDEWCAFGMDYTAIREQNDYGAIDYYIEPGPNGRILYIEYSEGKLYKRRCTRVEIYGEDGQVVNSVELSQEGNDLEVYKEIDEYGRVCYSVNELIHLYITNYGASTTFTKRTCIFDFRGKLILEIVGDPRTDLDDALMHGIDFKVEIKNEDAEVIRVYEPSGPNSLVGAHYLAETGLLTALEQTLDHKTLMEEWYNPITKTVIYRHRSNYDEAGNLVGEEIIFWDGKVVTTESAFEGYYTKVEFYDKAGELKKTVEPIEGSVYISLDFRERARCIIVFRDKNGADVGADVYYPGQ